MARRATGWWVYAGESAGVITPPRAVFTRPAEIDNGFYVVRVAGPDGWIIGELQGRLESVSWRVDGYGAASMLVPLETIVRTPYLLEFGNLIRIDFSNGLRSWAGVIDVPREVTVGAIRIQMYEASYMLGWRLATPGVMFEDNPQSAAVLIYALVGGADLPLDAMRNHTAGEPLSVEVGEESRLAAVERVRSLDPDVHYDVWGGSWSDPHIRPTVRIFREYWSDDTADAVLLQGYNLAEVSMMEQGPIWNRMHVKAKMPADVIGETQERYERFTADNLYSQPRHAMRETLVTLPDVDEDVSEWYATRYAQTQVDLLATARRRVGGTSLNLAPALWRNFTTGSKVRIESYSPAPMAMEATVLGLEYSPAAGRMVLIFDDVATTMFTR